MTEKKLTETTKTIELTGDAVESGVQDSAGNSQVESNKTEDNPKTPSEPKSQEEAARASKESSDKSNDEG
jgi:hypothetical protein